MENLINEEERDNKIKEYIKKSSEIKKVETKEGLI